MAKRRARSNNAPTATPPSGPLPSCMPSWTIRPCWLARVSVKVDADYTSQACPRCGSISPDNRPKSGLLFVCQNCHYPLHADLIGARNISLRTLVIRQDWMATGKLSDVPDVTDREAKAARRHRYAELRWSPATSPAL